MMSCWEQSSLTRCKVALGWDDDARLSLDGLDQGFADPGVAVPLIDRGIGGEAIEIALAISVPDPDTLTAGQYDIERLVVVSAQLGLDSDQLLN